MKFSIGTIISITTGVLVTDMHNLYTILDYMTGEKLYTHQLSRAADECAPCLIEQLPFLKDISSEGIDATNWESWLKALTAYHGEEFEIQPLPKDKQTPHRNPLTELESMVGKDKIIVVEIPSKE
jgi:hypothetical protein